MNESIVFEEISGSPVPVHLIFPRKTIYERD